MWWWLHPTPHSDEVANHEHEVSRGDAVDDEHDTVMQKRREVWDDTNDAECGRV